MNRTWGVLGVPSSAGAKTGGIEKAPQVLRQAGVTAALEQVGAPLVDHGDLPRTRHRRDKANPRAQNVDDVVAIAQNVAEHVGHILDAGETPLVIGGDCSITVGVMAAYIARQPETVLLYVDGGVDLEVPATNPEGNLDSMGMAHMLGADGANESLSRVGLRFPLLTPEQVVYYGVEAMPDDDAEEILMRQFTLRHTRPQQISGRAQAAAADVLESIQQPFLLHFDVDVIDFVDFPIADVPAINQGITLAEALASIAVFAASPLFAGIVITEINPDHMDEGDAEYFVTVLAQALSGTL